MKIDTIKGMGTKDIGGTVWVSTYKELVRLIDLEGVIYITKFERENEVPYWDRKQKKLKVSKIF